MPSIFCFQHLKGRIFCFPLSEDLFVLGCWSDKYINNLKSPLALGNFTVLCHFTEKTINQLVEKIISRSINNENNR